MNKTKSEKENSSITATFLEDKVDFEIYFQNGCFLPEDDFHKEYTYEQLQNLPPEDKNIRHDEVHDIFIPKIKRTVRYVISASFQGYRGCDHYASGPYSTN